MVDIGKNQNLSYEEHIKIRRFWDLEEEVRKKIAKMAKMQSRPNYGTDTYV